MLHVRKFWISWTQKCRTCFVPFVSGSWWPACEWCNLSRTLVQHEQPYSRMPAENTMFVWPSMCDYLLFRDFDEIRPNWPDHGLMAGGRGQASLVTEVVEALGLRQKIVNWKCGNDHTRIWEKNETKNIHFWTSWGFRNKPTHVTQIYQSYNKCCTR